MRRALSQFDGVSLSSTEPGPSIFSLIHGARTFNEGKRMIVNCLKTSQTGAHHESLTRPSRSFRGGFTVLEVVVVIAILGVMFALLLPAVQGAREAARRLHCANNLRQYGLALHNYESTMGSFPGGYNGTYSFHVMLLPMLEQTALYNAINLQEIAGLSPINQTITATRVGIFLCPSESITTVYGVTNYARASYAGCTGDGRGTSQHMTNGIFASDTFTYTRLNDIRDGLSSTAATSEWKLSDFGTNDVGRLQFFPAGGSPPDYDSFVAGCLSPDRTSAGPTLTKGRWLEGGPMTLYDHVLPVNGPNCIKPPPQDPSVMADPLQAFSAGSQHPGGVNVLMADGQVRFIRQSILLAVWHAISTRNGGEIVSGDSY